MLTTYETTIEKLKNNKSSVTEINDQRKKLIEEYFQDKTGEEIAEYLISSPVSETGGITALSGFYYQFLVTIEYMIEMMEGKWDCIIMEHHDDIVVVKNDKIRFIQVKTSQENKLYVTESPANGLYNRSKKEKGGVTFRRPNSWIDKLFSNATVVKKTEGYVTEFQLYASYHFISTLNYNINDYTGNKDYSMPVSSEDNLLRKLSMQTCHSDGKDYDYFTECGESLDTLLQRLYLYKGMSLQKIDTFRNDLCMKLKGLIFDDNAKNIIFELSDLDMLIGKLFEKCTDKAFPNKLIITPDKTKDLLNELKDRALYGAGKTVKKHDSITVIDEVIQDLINELDGLRHTEKVSDLIFKYQDYLHTWIEQENGSIRLLLNRLFEGTDRTIVYSNLREIQKKTSLTDLIILIMMLFISEKTTMKFEGNESLVIKKSLQNKLGYSFLRLERKKKKDEAIIKLGTIIKSASSGEQLYLINSDLTVIIQNYADGQFDKAEIIEIPINDEIVIEELKNDNRLNEVTFMARILPGEILKNGFIEALDEEDLSESLNVIKEKMKEEKFLE